ncbi:MAG: helix-turn-helix domain-containing protein [Kiritimatiellae bacterium]|nr:helix-turn-helix domain-containing protein [Kiritimatiellia bacterium]
MRPKKTWLLPKALKSLEILGQNLKLARIRRRISAAMMCERAGVSHATLTAIEQGKPSVSMAGYMSVLFCLNMHTDMEKVAADDVLGRELQDLKLPKRVHA